MQVDTHKPVEADKPISQNRNRVRCVASRARLWLSEKLSSSGAREIVRSRRALIITLSLIFLLALGVRLFYWQDMSAGIAQGDTLLTGLMKEYSLEAHRIVNEGGILIPNGDVDAGNARLVLHPPGYALLLAAIYGDRVSDRIYPAIQLLQILCDAAAALALFFIALELLPFAVAIMAALLVALSPHLAYYSLWLSPDSLAALPILIAVYLIIRSAKRPRLRTTIAAGAMVGFSCWLRANALALAPFLAIAVPLLFERGRRLLHSIALVSAAVIVISPITIRNWIIFHRFIPVSVDAGLALVEGVAAYDEEGRFAMPGTDREALKRDVEWHNRPDYAGNLWSPDGFERDEYRFKRGLEVIRSHPAWFAGVMLRRAAFMLSYDKPQTSNWPFNTVLVPLVSSEPTFGHDIAQWQQAELQWATSAQALLASGQILSAQSQAQLAADLNSLQITGDASSFADQFASAPVAVEKNRDYVLKVSLNSVSGPIAIKITSADRRITLASALVNELCEKPAKGRKLKAKNRDEQSGSTDDFAEQQMAQIKLPFASGNRSEALLVISNNGPSQSRPKVEITRAELYRLGPTPHLWTRVVRPTVRAIQRNLYTTSRMLPMVLTGIALLAIAGRRKALVALLAVPLYYLTVQSAFHTEYRYILAIHYFLFVMAAVTLYTAGKLIGRGARRILKAEGKNEK